MVPDVGKPANFCQAESSIRIVLLTMLQLTNHGRASVKRSDKTCTQPLSRHGSKFAHVQELEVLIQFGKHLPKLFRGVTSLETTVLRVSSSRNFDHVSDIGRDGKTPAIYAHISVSRP